MNKKQWLSIILALCLLVASLSTGISAMASEPTNIASGKDVYVSSCSESAPYLVDADSAIYTNEYISEWCDNPAQSQYIVVDLCGAYEVGSINLHTPYNQGLPKEFQVLVYDGSQWVLVYEGIAPSDGSDICCSNSIAFETVVCNAVKVVAKTLSTYVDDYGNPGDSYVVRLVELEVMGVESSETLETPDFSEFPNIALSTNGTVASTDTPWDDYMYTPSDEVGEGYGPQVLINDAYSIWDTYFSSARSDEYQDKDITATLEFDATYRINQISLYPAHGGGEYVGGFPEDFTISALTSTGWKDVVSVTGYQNPQTENPQIFHLADISCSAVRITSHKNRTVCEGGEWNNYALCFSEITVHGVEVENGSTPPGEYGEIQTQGSAFASTNYEYSEDYIQIGLSQLNDGTPGDPWNTFYCSESFATAKCSEFVGVVFEDAYWIDKVSISGLGSEFPKAFHISVYDGKQWVDVVSEQAYIPDNNDCVTAEFTFEKVCGNAVKLTVDEMNITNPNDQTYGIKIAELAISGEKESGVQMSPPATARYNVCEGMSITASSVVDWGEPTFGSNLNNLVDNLIQDVDPTETLYASTFLSTPDNCEWVQVAFDAPVLAECVEFDVWNECFPKDFRIEVFDGTEWKRVVEKYDYETACYKFGFPATACTAIRMTVTELDVADGTSYSFVIRDMRVFAENTSVSVKRAEEVPKRQNQSAASRVVGNGYGLEYLIDGTFGGENYYTSKQYSSPSHSVELEFFFERVTYVDRVRFDAHEAGVFPENIKIYAMVDHEWKLVDNVVNYSAGADNRHEFSFEAIVCSRIKLVAKGLPLLADGTYGWQLDDVWLNGVAVGPNVEGETVVENVAVNKPAYAATELSTDMANIKHLNDGITMNYYSSRDIGNINRTEWVAIDLQNSYEITSINLVPRYYNGEILGFPQSFTVEVWNGTHWVVVAEKTDMIATEELTLNIEPIVGNAVRIISTKQGVAYPNRPAINALQLAELEVYGAESDKLLKACNNFGLQLKQQVEHSEDNAISPITGDFKPLYLYVVLLFVSTVIILNIRKKGGRKL